MGRVLDLLWLAGHFLQQVFYTKSPTAPILTIFIGIESFRSDQNQKRISLQQK